jgi:hypothetical protein
MDTFVSIDRWIYWQLYPYHKTSRYDRWIHLQRSTTESTSLVSPLPNPAAHPAARRPPPTNPSAHKRHTKRLRGTHDTCAGIAVSDRSGRTALVEALLAAPTHSFSRLSRAEVLCLLRARSGNALSIPQAAQIPNPRHYLYGFPFAYSLKYASRACGQHQPSWQGRAGKEGVRKAKGGKRMCGRR